MHPAHRTLILAAVTAAALGAVTATSAQAVPAGKGGTTPPVPAGTERPVTEQFPGSLRLEYFQPRAVTRADAEYLAWISGADGADAEAVHAWALALAESDAAWVEAAFEPLQADSQAYIQTRVVGADTSEERAAALASIMKRRDTAAEALYAREREQLRAMLPEHPGDAAARDAIIERVMAARIADAVDVGITSGGQMVPDALALLGAASRDPRTPPDAAAAVRTIAIENAPRLTDTRRRAVEACVHAGTRAKTARARAARQGEPSTDAVAAVHRPVAAGIAAVTALNRDLLASARGVLPGAVADELERAYLRRAYRELGEDAFEYRDVAQEILPLLGTEARAQADAMVAADARARAAAHAEVLRLFDRAVLRSIERGRVRNADDGERFVRALLEYHRAAHGGADRTIGALGEMGRTAAGWDEQAFAASRARWRKQVDERLHRLMDFGALSFVASDDMFPENDPVTPRPVGAGR